MDFNALNRKLQYWRKHLQRTDVLRIQLTKRVAATGLTFSAGTRFKVLGRNADAGTRGYWVETDQTREGYLLIYDNECTVIARAEMEEV